jgi:hypothetical protein
MGRSPLTSCTPGNAWGNTFCFAVDRDHARQLKEQFEAAGVPSAYMDAWSALKGGSLSNMANVTWAKHAVFEVVLRDMEWRAEKKLHEHRRFVGILGVVLGASAR